MKYGITAGFGNLLTASEMTTIRACDWDIVRQDVQRCTVAQTATLINQITQYGLTPLVLCTAAQVTTLPNGIDAEVLEAIDPTPSGLEPSFRVDPHKYADAINAIVPIAEAKGIRLWTCLAGLDKNALAWLATVCASLDPYCGISVHRYPPADCQSWEESHVSWWTRLWSSRTGRQIEMDRFRAIIGNRLFGVGEFGYNQMPWQEWYHKLVFKHRHSTDQEIIDMARGEYQYWQDSGATFACWWQFKEGPSRCATHPDYADKESGGFGLMRPDGRYKPVMELWKYIN